jgi:hypothetical protein
MTWTKPSQNSTSYTQAQPTFTVTIPKGTLIGILGGHAYATDVTVTYIGYNSNYTKVSNNSSNWTKT